MRRAHGFEKTTPPALLTPTHLPLHRGGNRTRQHRTTLAPLRKGSSRRSRLRGRFFSGARTLLSIRLLRCPDRSLTAKPAQRATDGRPYELKSVPTKTVAIRTSGNCAILVQNFVCTLAFPLRGRCRRSRRMRCFFNSGFTFYLCFYCVGPTGHLRQNRHSGRPMVAPTNRFERGQSFCTLSAGSGALAVFSAATIPGDRNKRIRRCGGSPLNYISQAGRIQEN